MAHLRIKNITKKFGEFTAVNKVSFTAEKGEFVTLLGPSGCGKTTLLKSIGGFFDDLSSGHIEIANEVVNRVPPERRDTAMCFQSYALFPHLTVFKNVSFGLEQKRFPKEKIRKRVMEVLSQVDMVVQVDKFPGELSGGQQQRVALARAIAVRPSVILFDEPLSNLDAKLRERVRFEIRALQKKMLFTAVYVTHDQQEALALSDKVLVMNKGCVEQGGSPREIYSHPANRFVADFIGTANIMAARILDEKQDVYSIDSPLGVLTVSINGSNAKRPSSDKVYVGWRPESITDPTVKKGKRALPNMIEACIHQTAFLGSCVHILAATKEKNGRGTYFNIEAPRSFNAHPGTVFYFGILPESIFFLEACDE